MPAVATKRTKVEFTVNQEDIVNGLKRNSRACPVALAAKRIFPYGNCCTGEGLKISVTGVNGCPIFFGLLPPKAKKFIKDFEEGKPVKPFSFKVEDWTALCFVETCK
jgi:hypothetical protein